MKDYTGKVTSVLFQNDDFMIGVLTTDDNLEVKFTGNIYGVNKDEDLTLKGEWINHSKYGEQLKVHEWKRPIPKTKEQIIAFLGSGLVKGVGKKRAIDIVEKLGNDAITIINNKEEEALAGIKGIGKKTATNIVESIKATFEVQKIITELLRYGIPANLTLKLYKNYGSETALMVKQNPYTLTEIDGVGFHKADEIARNIGILPTSGYRVKACIDFILSRICHQKGHTYVNEEELVNETLSTLNHNSSMNEQVYEEELMQSIYSLEDRTLVIENELVYPKYLFKYEEGLARKLSRMRECRDGEALSFLDERIKKYQKKNQIILADNQRQAIKLMMEEQLLVLTGGPGTGKTTVVKAVIDIYKNENPNSVVMLTAPTGRASQKLSDSTGYNAMTMHRAIGYRQGELPEYHDGNKLEVDLLVIDEMSMVDLQIAHWTFNALPRHTKVLFIGDTDQLPSVGSGNVLYDVIRSGITTIELTEIFRQAEESQVITNAHRINNGQSLLIDKEKDDFYFIHEENLERMCSLIVLSAIRFTTLGYDLEDILILSPMRKGEVGTHLLNERLRDKLNPKEPNKSEFVVGKSFFRTGDKVLHNTNNREKDVYNGEIGIVKEISKERNEDNNKIIDVMICDYDGKKVKYYKEDCIELELGYAITIHKSQGGEAPIIIMPVTTSHYVMLARNLYYTGVTRAKEKVVLIGSEQAMNIAINNNKTSKRNSKLSERIKYQTEHIRNLNGEKLIKHS